MIAGVLFTHVWCRNIGHSPMFMRKAAAVREPTNEILGLVGPVERDFTNTGKSL